MSEKTEISSQIQMKKRKNQSIEKKTSPGLYSQTVTTVKPPGSK
jgi:hypothetical protein